ncbi:cytochrome c oxidase subunit 3 [Nocardia miyunensis]|uniref:cytochrome c oxidase subunit 3 n=1 Tax=Nocardia miyunensis TaxID=282684 RepID=UPI00082A45FF|nr:cytochrome c oxidase subunit 3 [Nocardia miyunensis]
MLNNIRATTVNGHGVDQCAAEAGPSSGRPGERIARSKLIPGESSLWLLLICDLFQFSIFFALFSYNRGRNPALFETSARGLHIGLGFVNTVVLISGSVLVAVALRRWDSGYSTHIVRRMLFWAGLCGVLFILIKITEYILAAHDGHTVGTNDFFMFYFVLTGFHIVHVLAGSAGLFFAARAVGNGQATPSPDRRGAVYSVGLFWHMVDIIWLVLFSLLYIT